MTLHFVYNVEGTPLAMALDFVHRLRSPETYPCRLCDVTYGRWVKKAAWRRFVRDLPGESRFHLRGSFRRRFPDHADTPLPAVFLERSPGRLEPLIPAHEMQRVSSLEELERLLEKRLAGV